MALCGISINSHSDYELEKKRFELASNVALRLVVLYGDIMLYLDSLFTRLRNVPMFILGFMSSACFVDRLA